jgi:hypothetical protein
MARLIKTPHRTRTFIAWVFLAVGLILPHEGLAGQQDPAPHEHPAPEPAQHEHPTPATPPAGPAQLEHQHDTGAARLFSPRDASGTAWLPDATPMYGFHARARGWEVMLHGNGFIQLLHEAAPEHRGGTQAGSINWAMAMARRPAAGGALGLRMMMSLEPWTISGCGYPNLLATGELCDGDNIHDKQHPHDLFMEVAAEYDHALTGALRWHVYGGLAGEPALGPPGFPHRISALPNPVPPVAHHWLDATHITFGVLTSGVYNDRWKAEASIFNGREPDEQRYDLDLAALDSVSARLWFTPTASLALQVSAGHLEEAEADHAGGSPIDVDRLTASATYHRVVGGTGLWATTIGWGANRESGETTHGLTAESSVALGRGHTWFGRLELNGKPAHDLHIHESTQVFTVGKLQGGYTHYLPPRLGFQTGIGGILSAALVPEALQPRYGGVGTGFGVFLTVRPAAHQMTP